MVTAQTDRAQNEKKKAAGKASLNPLAVEAKLARLERLLRRKPLHGQAFKEFVGHYAQLDQMELLIEQYQRKTDASRKAHAASLVSGS